MKIKDLPKPIRKWAKKNEKKFKPDGGTYTGLVTNFDWKRTTEGAFFWAAVYSGENVEYLRKFFPYLPWPTAEKEPDEFEEYLKKTISSLENWPEGMESRNVSLKNYREILTRYKEIKK